MSSSDFGLDFSEINDKSTISELIRSLLSSFREEEFQLVERILIRREEELKRQLVREQNERSLLEKSHAQAELERLEMLEEVKKLEREKQLAEENAQFCHQKFKERIAHLEKAFAYVLTEIGTRAHSSPENDLQKEDFPEAETNGFTQENNNDSSYAAAPKRICDEEFHDKGQFMLENSDQADPSSTPIRYNPRSSDVVEIIDSDDEAPGDQKLHVSNICISEANSSKKGVTYKESGRSEWAETEDENKRNPKRKGSLTDSDDSNSCPLGKRKTQARIELLDHRKDSIVNNYSTNLESAATGSQAILTPVQGPMVNSRCQEKAGADCSLQTASRKIDFDSSDDSSDYSSTDSEDECSDSINEMIASIRKDSGKSQSTLNVAADMLSELQKDNELCMSAVCALYRKKISAEKSINCTSSPLKLGFYQFDAMSGRDLAEFLIDGDPQYKLKRTVSEVEQKDPRLLDRCKVLAILYYETLFEIYHRKEDPFFHPRT